MLTFVCDDRNFNNLYPLRRDGQDLTEPCWLTRWFDYYQIDYNTVKVEQSTPESWYPISVNFWNFEQDYLQSLDQRVQEKLADGCIRLLFLYREADDPGLIQNHIQKMCDKIGISPGLVWLVSGNTQADSIPNCRFFWYFDTSYFFDTRRSQLPKINSRPRDRRITCLARIHKQWREWFVYNLSRSISFDQNYISYGSVANSNDFGDINIWENPEYRCVDGKIIDILPPDPVWKARLPIKTADLSADQHNTHSIVVADHYQNSYWNVVLETLLDTETSGGIFITEKTLKPIRNGQSFIVLGCAGTLRYLREQGYQTFGNVIDESYDDVVSVHDRWYRVYQTALDLANLNLSELEKLQACCLPALRHNQIHFQRSRASELQRLAADLDTIE